jgi:hypothetical protein
LVEAGVYSNILSVVMNFEPNKREVSTLDHRSL